MTSEGSRGSGKLLKLDPKLVAPFADKHPAVGWQESQRNEILRSIGYQATNFYKDYKCDLYGPRVRCLMRYFAGKAYLAA